MEYFTLRNTAIVALVQIGVIVSGVLAAGIMMKWYAENQLTASPVSLFVAQSGHYILALPLVWTVWALWLLWAGDDYETTRLVTLCVGILVVVLLVFVIVSTVVQPMLRLLVGCGFGLD